MIFTKLKDNMYSEKDFKGCYFNPIKKDLASEEKLSTMFDILGEVAQPEAVVNSLVSIFDPSSPYVRDIQDHIERKKSAAFDFGVSDIDGIVAFSNKSYAEAANWFLRTFVRSMDWAIIQANTETFWEYQLRLMTPISYGEEGAAIRDKDVMSAIQVKSKLAEDLSLISDRIQRHTRIFYGGDEQIIKAASKSISSEQIANVLKNR